MIPDLSVSHLNPDSNVNFYLPCRLRVRSPPFHGGNFGSNPCRGTFVNVIMKYTIISAIGYYELKDIFNFVKSINKSGFIGNKIMFVYDGIDNETKKFLLDNGWFIVECSIIQDVSLHNQRFIDIANSLDKFNVDIVIFLDARDIIFQQNPTEWLDNHMTGDILATSESLKFKHDDWSTEIGSFFPNEWDWVKECEIYNCGVIIGKKNQIKEIFTLIFNSAVQIKKLDYPIDQIMFNILIHNKKYNTQFIKQQNGLAVHLAINFKYNEPYYFTENLGKVLENGDVVNDENKKFFIVHQYERDSNLKKLIDNRYEVNYFKKRLI